MLIALAPAATARADDWYVAPTGNDTATGTRAQPFATVERAEQAATPGDTVWIRGGEYVFSGTTRTVGVAFNKSGSAGQPIRYFAEPGERPVFDLFALEPQARVTGLDVQASFLHLKGITVRGVQQRIVGDSWGVRVRGDDNLLEQLEVHGCQAPGVFVSSGARNTVRDCDSHDNYDPLEDGGNADGFGCHSNGGDNLFDGCRAWNNSDDGFDFINAPGTCVAEHSWAFDNGFEPGTRTPAGNGAGFKAGGFGSPPTIPGTGVPRHAVRFSVAFGNRAQGFYANHHPGGLDFLHDVAFDNPSAFDMLVEGGTSTHLLQNNVAFGTGSELVRFSGGTETHNSWNLGVTANADDFASIAASAASAPRNADGSLPDDFMRLVEGSDLIDRGTDLGFAFIGTAPDLGAFEHGAVAPTSDAAVALDGGSPDAGVGNAGAAGMGGTQAPLDAATAGSAAVGGAALVTGGNSANGGVGATATNGTQPTSCACSAPGTPPTARHGTREACASVCLLSALLLSRRVRRRTGPGERSRGSCRSRV